MSFVPDPETGDVELKSIHDDVAARQTLLSGRDAGENLHEMVLREGVEEWGAVSNLDQFFTRLYDYYHHKGLSCIITARVANLVTLAFTIAMSAILLVIADWGRLVHCDEDFDESCKDFTSYFSLRALHEPSAWDIFCSIYLGAFSLYWLWCLITLPHTIWVNLEMRKFFVHRLRIPTRTMQTLQWSEVVESIIQLNKSGQYKVQINKPDLTAHDIVARVARRDNYFVALIMREDVLDLSIPGAGLLCGLLPSRFLTKHLEYNLRWCLLDAMFDKRFQLRRSFLKNPASLSRRFRLFGLLNLLLMPFIALFLTTYFVFKHVEDFHSKRTELSLREWSPLARWKFRELNELPHFFERRMNASYGPANVYEKQFPYPGLSIVASAISFATGALLGLLVIMSLVDDSLPLQIQFLDRNLIWYMTVLAAIVGTARALVPRPEDKVMDPAGTMEKVVLYTHYNPSTWRHSRYSTYDVRDEFLALYQRKYSLFLLELVSLFATPLMMWFTLPACSQRIADFVGANTAHADGVGDVLVDSVFSLQRYSKVGGAPSAAEAALAHVPREQRDRVLRECRDKMLQSFVSFHVNYPKWAPPADGTSYLRRLSRFVARREQQRHQQLARSLLAMSGSEPAMEGASAQDAQRAAALAASFMCFSQDKYAPIIPPVIGGPPLDATASGSAAPLGPGAHAADDEMRMSGSVLQRAPVMLANGRSQMADTYIHVLHQFSEAEERGEEREQDYEAQGGRPARRR